MSSVKQDLAGTSSRWNVFVRLLKFDIHFIAEGQSLSQN